MTDGHDGSKSPRGMPSNQAPRDQRESIYPLPQQQQDFSHAPPITSKERISQDARPKPSKKRVSLSPVANTPSTSPVATSATANQAHVRRSEGGGGIDREVVWNPDDAGQDTDLVALPLCMWHEEAYEVLKSASWTPPVSPETLKELELPFIQNNIDVRVDIAYNEDLHFTPISGRRGEEKRFEAGKYFSALEWEFRIYLLHPPGLCDDCLDSAHPSFSFQQRLPKMFQVLQALLLLLVPHHDHEDVLNVLDLDLIMQQVRKGVLDVLRLSTWLSDLLTTHCAPIRDTLAFDMKDKISEGAYTRDMAALVAGLEQLFSFCEAMKLDVANHQIRTFRYPLIADGISFQRDYFQTRINMGKLDPRPSVEWFIQKVRHFSPEQISISEYSRVVFVLVLLVTRPDERIPDFFKHDVNRILYLREEVSDLMHLEACWDIICEGTTRADSTTRQILNSRLLDLTDGDCAPVAGLDAVWDSNLDVISTELARVIFEKSGQSQQVVSADAVAKVRMRLSLCLDKEMEHRAEMFALGLQQRVLYHAGNFAKLSALQIYESQQAYRQAHQAQQKGRHIPELEDIARTMAHMAVTHWKVWCDWYSQPP